jgi:hypothetical protein
MRVEGEIRAERWEHVVDGIRDRCVWSVDGVEGVMNFGDTSATDDDRPTRIYGNLPN